MAGQNHAESNKGGSGPRVYLDLQLLPKFILFPGGGLDSLHELGVFSEGARRAELEA
jgi:hypothetical protein